MCGGVCGVWVCKGERGVCMSYYYFISAAIATKISFLMGPTSGTSVKVLV